MSTSRFCPPATRRTKRVLRTRPPRDKTRAATTELRRADGATWRAGLSRTAGVVTCLVARGPRGWSVQPNARANERARRREKARTRLVRARLETKTRTRTVAGRDEGVEARGRSPRRPRRSLRRRRNARRLFRRRRRRKTFHRRFRSRSRRRGRAAPSASTPGTRWTRVLRRRKKARRRESRRRRRRQGALLRGRKKLSLGAPRRVGVEARRGRLARRARGCGARVSGGGRARAS
jgi:arginine/serine-rich splicing factor 12